MAKPYKIGINEKTASELTVRTPQQIHDANLHLIPMQSPECLRHVRLQNVARREQEGWVTKCQNKLQQAKIGWADVIHQKENDRLITAKEAQRLFDRVAHAKDSEELKEVTKDL